MSLNHLSIHNLQEESPVTNGGIVNYLKLGLISLKLIYFSVCFILCIKNNTKYYGSFWIKENMYVLFYVFELACIVVFEFVTENIMLLYFMILLSTYSTYTIFFLLITDQNISKSTQNAQLIRIYVVAVHVCFALAIAFAFIPVIGAYCNETSVYPATFIILYGLNLVITIFTIIFFVKKFFSTQYTPINGLEHEKKIVCFRKQVKIFLQLSCVISFFQVLCGILGLASFQKSGNLGCIDSGSTWEQLQTYGNIFLALHVVQIILQTTVFNQIFYRIPATSGIFDKRTVSDDLQM